MQYNVNILLPPQAQASVIVECHNVGGGEVMILIYCYFRILYILKTQRKITFMTTEAR